MRNVLIAVGVLICICVIILLQAFIVWYSDNPEIWMSYWLGYENIKLIVIAACLLFAFHIGLVAWAARTRKVDWHWAIPLTILPYMIGVTIQGLFY